MALEMAAGALLGSFFDYLINKMESPEVIDFFMGSAELDEGLLMKLKITMNTVSGLLDEAEEKQIFVPTVKRWLDDLKHTAYQADDLLDQIAYEDQRSKLEGRSLKRKVRKFIHSRNPFEKAVNEKLQEIHELIEHLLKQMHSLGLTLRKGIGEKLQSQQTTPLPDVNYDCNSIRHTEKEVIMKSLLFDGQRDGVICIEGQGGIGKTTTARQIYNDSRVNEGFDRKAWVHVSQEFDVVQIMKDIVRQVCSSFISDSKVSLVVLQDNLQKELNKKKFLLVLDDVWSAKDAEWEDLFRPLMFGANGMSKIIVTSRNRNVVSAKQAIQNSVYLNNLANEECWKLVKQYASADGKPIVDPKFDTPGREIAKKCGGLPLAAKIIGSLLRFKSSVSEWKIISESNLWDLVGDSILPVLKLSYHFLPSHLKQCVAYCGIFPKGYVFRKEFLIHLWIAEGFLHKSETKQSLEDLGCQCFDTLVSISFFEQAKDNESAFTMHDLVHDLSKSVFGDFGFRLGDGGSCKIPMKARHLFVKWGNVDDISNFINEGQLLRSFLIADCGGGCGVEDSKKTLDLLRKLKFLRVLHLENQWGMPKMLDFIGNLNHLRYLSLCGASIRRLPESTSCLYYLQILILWDCKNLVELPGNMGRLINLFCLDIRRTGLQDMPPQIGKLAGLRTLTTFILGKNGRSRIKELGELLNLKGQLSIEIRPDFTGTGDATKDVIVYPELLHKLEFKCDPESRNLDQAKNQLEGLCPHAEVESISITGFGGSLFPDWLTRLPNLVSLKLSQCKHCSSLPSLGQLASLKHLSVTGFDKVESIGSEFYGTNIQEQPFRGLQFLRFDQMPSWEKWESTAGAFPKLETLVLEGCHKLSNGLPSELPCLSLLDIQKCEQLELTLPKVADNCNMKLYGGSCCVKLVKRAARWQCLSIRNSEFGFLRKILKLMEDDSTASLEVEFGNCDSLDFFPLESFPKIKTLHIRGCQNLISFSPTSTNEFIFPCQDIHIVDCANLSLSPLLSDKTIKTIILEDSSFILRFVRLSSGSFCLQVSFLPNPADLKQFMGVHDCTIQEIEIGNDVKHSNIMEWFPSVKSVKIVNSCKTSGHPLSVMDMVNPGDFSYFNSWLIASSSDIIIFPKEGKPTNNLTSLSLRNCNKLKSLPEWTNHLFPCLENLEIVQCPELESFPSGSLPSQLKVLHVEECSMLTSLAISVTFSANKEHEESRSKQTLMSSGLVALKLRKLQKLKSLDYGVLTKLADLEIRECPELQSVPQGISNLLPSLGRLSICICPKLKSFLKEDILSTLNSLEIQYCNIFSADIMRKNFQVLPNFSKLAVAGCQNVELPEKMLFPSTLTVLRLLDLEKLRSLKLNGLGQLRELLIGNCPKLRFIPEYTQNVLPSLVVLTIHDCPILESFLRGGLPSRLEGLYVWHCDKLIAGLMRYNLRQLPSLSLIKIGGYDDVESLPEETLLPSTLASLELGHLGNLKYLDLQHLNSLQHLTIEECPRLVGLPEELLNRHHLTIHGCPLLETRMRNRMASLRSLSSVGYSGSRQ